MLFVGRFNEEKDLLSTFQIHNDFTYVDYMYPNAFVRLIVSHREINQTHRFFM